ncbi:uncharacterized protein LOC125718858 [Brienomyrus brachyistius]|uniref:uncharacterized protein LOC125718858 n=1 Tax=Brienomyrus brachyistius TaxID=42636 RepID=UPI0020B2B8DC|nr:uncharacterized protein LOC125718858 [Brienomyrus brachyistius]XP_048848990.1 uncharacterized protein LOC125718858 [Brienomyrus brachyistius]XP_048848991.1 uncharacterized protein LOC125718858 [Brienomyrus brachyistius]XP_048848992.1 uncharacterized protein LOC125718858 [Brienomyrus brachyistius]XP_048848993.1 uncharacterized protein LOC125718858 [Brienomyrus brachyistius]XP_048848994.1 uncharacterized protein LOC125718858 [Brienomyrus brachyistius]XP_048848995.1 uncharacterized protein LO
MKKMLKCLYCQACGIQFKFFSACKKHMYGAEHKQRIAKLFQTAPNKGAVHFPQLVVQEYLMRPNRFHAVIGLHLVTACIETAVGDPPFYLCHACQEKCPSSQIVQHLTSPDHHLAYFAHVAPEKLPFGWMSSCTATPTETYAAAELEERQCGTGVLRLLELPKLLFRTVRGLSYSQAMKQIFSTDDCKQCLEGQHVELFSLQKYCKDANRTYPLLGLQFLVELCCVNGSSPSCYLCLLCQKKVPQSQAVAHLVSFDHLYGYLDQIHPSSLESKSKYKVHSPVFRSMILNLAQQAEQLVSSADMQVMKVDAEVYEQTELLSFSNALKKLQEIRREQNLGDLQPQVMSGDRLVCRRKRKRANSPDISVKNKEGHVNADGCTSLGGALRSPGLTKTGPADSQRTVCRLVCQNCDPGVLYSSVKSYKQHVRGYQHQQCVDRLFPDLDKAACVRPPQRVPVPTLNVYESLIDYLRTEPIIGLHLVTMCITFSSKPPMYLCHACEEAFPSQQDVQHLTSADHYFSTLAPDDPEVLPFGWIHSHDVLSVLKPRAVAEEKRQSKSVLQMLCVPDTLFVEIKGACYSMAMKKLRHAIKLTAGLKTEEKVVLPEYLRNPKRKFPLLGLQFLVEYRSADPDEPSGYLCLLCQKKVRRNQTVLHVVSFDHLFAYLESTRPLSLGVKSDYKQYDEKHKAAMLDLASRALTADSPGEIQEVHLEPDVHQEVCRSSFVDALKKLQTFWKEKSQGDPQPQALPGQRTADTAERTEEVAAAVCPVAADEPRVCMDSGAVCQGVAKNPLPNQVPVPEPKADEPESAEGIGRDPTAVSLMEVEQESLSNRDLSNQEFVQYPRVPPELLLDPKRAQTTTGPIGESNWSKFWFLDGRPYPSIGLEAVVECRCLKHPTIYLCLTCTERITSSNICDHVISRRHQYYYIKSLYPELLPSWRDDPDETAWLVYHHDKKWDVQVVKLRPAAYQRIVSAPFYMAVQMIREEHDPYEPRPLITLEDVLDTGASGITQKQSSRLDARCGGADCCSWQSEKQGQDAYWSCRPQAHAKAADGVQATLFTDRSLQESVQPQASDSCETRKSVSPECPGSVQLVGTDTKTLTEKVLTAWKEMTEKVGGM